MTFESAELAGQILRAMENGSRDRLSSELECAERMHYFDSCSSSREQEQREVLSAVAHALRSQASPSEVQVHLLQHFAGTVKVCLS